MFSKLTSSNKSIDPSDQVSNLLLQGQAMKKMNHKFYQMDIKHQNWKDDLPAYQLHDSNETLKQKIQGSVAMYQYPSESSKDINNDLPISVIRPWNLTQYREDYNRLKCTT